MKIVIGKKPKPIYISFNEHFIEANFFQIIYLITRSTHLEFSNISYKNKA